MGWLLPRYDEFPDVVMRYESMHQLETLLCMLKVTYLILVYGSL
jgi:hypothetical protein